MDIKTIILEKANQGLVFVNPGGGTSEIIKVTDRKITYKRGNSKISLSIESIQDVYDEFKSKQCTSSELKKYKQEVFSSKDNGHSCNCTFLFSLLNYLNLASEIKGKGVKNNPFYVEIF
ncbi:hypothetical protein PV797_10295 [Clostridiaceae bacterium M8S5]|nr:hypothetical protein PV797_10295 [Clostridiaceae bacterium M8S5]